MNEQEFSALQSVMSTDLYPYLKMQSFREKRLKFLNENMSLRYPVELQMGTYLLVHLIPRSFTDKTRIIDLKKVIDQTYWLYPIGVSEKNTFEDFNFDGLIFAPGTHLKPAYTQLFRNGIIEALSTVARADKIISLLQMQQFFYTALKQYFRTLVMLNIQPPIHLFFKIVNGRDVKLSPQDIAQCGSEEKARSKLILLNELEFPEIIIDDLETDLAELIAPLFDICWNVFGYVGAPKTQLEDEASKPKFPSFEDK